MYFVQATGNSNLPPSQSGKIARGQKLALQFSCYPSSLIWFSFIIFMIFIIAKIATLFGNAHNIISGETLRSNCWIQAFGRCLLANPSTSRCPSHSTGIHWNPPEWDWIPQELLYSCRNRTGIRRNGIYWIK